MCFKKINNGFTLIECSVYLVGLMLLTYLVATFTNNTVRTLLHETVRQREANARAYTFQLLARDIRQAIPARNLWNVQHNELVMHHVHNGDSVSISWQVIYGLLYRIRRVNGKIIHKLCLAPIAEFVCSLCCIDGYVRAVKLHTPIERTIMVKNGPL